MTFTHLFSVHNTFYLINSSQDLELKTLDYKFKVTNFLQVLFCERCVCLKVNFIIQQKNSFEKNLFRFGHDCFKKCILLDRIDLSKTTTEIFSVPKILLN